MIPSSSLPGSLFFLGELTVSHVDDRYVNWLLDPKVNKFMEVKNTLVSIESQKDFITGINLSPNSIIFGIFTESGILIGSIKCGPISFEEKSAEIGLMIGDSNYWGRGIASESIELICKFAKTELNLSRLTAGVYSKNLASFRAFKANGFEIDNVLKEFVEIESGFLDDLIRLSKSL
jgi:ribosomal-protein-alanine N-acetyltransferase